MIAFDGEMIMGFALQAYISGELALSQQGIGGNVFPFNIDGIEQWDGGLDFVGTLELFIVCFQRTYFFWV